MALKYWWLLPLGLAVLAAAGAWLWRRRDAVQEHSPVAHAERLTELPAYRQAVAAHRKRLACTLAAFAVLAVSLLVAAARPVSESSSIPEQLNRDIMLCLDVSGSMLETDEAIVGVFSQLVGNFKGERIGMTIFDSSAVMVFPLTDDYEFVEAELATATQALSSDAGTFDYLAGTYEAAGSSLIGDGLANCVNGFPAAGKAAGETERSRSIIFATDNMLAGRPLFTLEQATGLAKTAKARVYAFNPNDYGPTGSGASESGPNESGSSGSDPGSGSLGSIASDSGGYGPTGSGAVPLFGDAAAGLQKTAEATGGAYYALESEEAVPSIVEKVQATEASLLLGAPQKTVVDHPGAALGVAGLALLALALVAAAARRGRP